MKATYYVHVSALLEVKTESPEEAASLARRTVQDDNGKVAWEVVAYPTPDLGSVPLHVSMEE